MINFTKR